MGICGIVFVVAGYGLASRMCFSSFLLDMNSFL